MPRGAVGDRLHRTTANDDAVYAHFENGRQLKIAVEWESEEGFRGNVLAGAPDEIVEHLET